MTLVWKILRIQRKNPNELQILESAVTKLRDNLDSSSERKHLNEVFTKQAVAKHLKRLKALESVSANLFQDLVRVREGAIHNRDLALKFASVLTIKNQTDVPSEVIEYISKTAGNYKGNMIESFPLLSEIFSGLYLWRLCNRIDYAQMFILFTRLSMCHIQMEIIQQNFFVHWPPKYPTLYVDFNF